MIYFNFRALALFIIILVTSACIIPSNLTNNNRESPSPASPQTPSGESRPTDDSQIVLNPAEKDQVSVIESLIFNKTNEQRKNNGLSPVKFDDGLSKLARQHSKNMLDNNFFSHTDNQGLGPSDRKNRYYPELFGGIFENIYNISGFLPETNEKIADTIVTGWMNSPGHRENILNKGITHLGVGVSKTNDRIYATQNFADAQALFFDSVPKNLKTPGPLSLKFKFMGNFDKNKLSVFVDFPDKTKEFFLPDGTFFVGTDKYKPSWSDDNFSVNISCAGNGDYQVKMGVENTFYENQFVFNWNCQ